LCRRCGTVPHWACSSQHPSRLEHGQKSRAGRRRWRTRSVLADHAIAVAANEIAESSCARQPSRPRVSRDSCARWPRGEGGALAQPQWTLEPVATARWSPTTATTFSRNGVGPRFRLWQIATHVVRVSDSRTSLSFAEFAERYDREPQPVASATRIAIDA
jgi:hypothetical protein